MTDTTYNGWTNYATWRVNLEIFDGMEPDDFGFSRNDEFTLTEVYELADAMQNYADELIDQSPDGLTKGFARAFLADVSWREIAQHMADAFARA
jgi:NTP pyrophosphatase (non-canonical NTP hydrolase)